MNCSQPSSHVRPVQALGPHTAPLGMRFYLRDAGAKSAFPADYDRAALVALHGSWNRCAGVCGWTAASGGAGVHARQWSGGWVHCGAYSLPAALGAGFAGALCTAGCTKGDTKNDTPPALLHRKLLNGYKVGVVNLDASGTATQYRTLASWLLSENQPDNIQIGAALEGVGRGRDRVGGEKARWGAWCAAVHECKLKFPVSWLQQ